MWFSSQFSSTWRRMVINSYSWEYHSPQNVNNPSDNKLFLNWRQSFNHSVNVTIPIQSKGFDPRCIPRKVLDSSHIHLYKHCLDVAMLLFTVYHEYNGIVAWQSLRCYGFYRNIIPLSVGPLWDHVFTTYLMKTS